MQSAHRGILANMQNTKKWNKKLYACGQSSSRRCRPCPTAHKSFKYSIAKACPNTSELPVINAERRSIDQSEDEQALKPSSIISNRLQKLLGLYFQPNGDSSETGRKLIAKANSKLAGVKIPKGSGTSVCSDLSKIYITPTVNWSITKVTKNHKMCGSVAVIQLR